MKRIIFCLLVLINGYCVKAQELHIGNKMPDVRFRNIINSKTSVPKLSDFGSKLIILDFWSTSCSSCIALFPHLQELQQRYKKDIQIILVNGKSKIWKDDRTKIQKVIDRIREHTGIKITLPVVFDNKEIDGYFSYQSIPHEVWIKNDEIFAITGPNEVSAKNINDILTGKNIRLRTKDDVLVNLNQQPLSQILADKRYASQKPLFSSIFFKGYIDGLTGSIGVHLEDDGKLKGWYATNMPLLDIYSNVYEKQIRFPPNRIILNTKDSLLFKSFPFLKGDLLYSSVFNYELTVAPVTRDVLLNYVQTDLERAFSKKVYNAKKLVPCLVLTVSDRFSTHIIPETKKVWDLDSNSLKKSIRGFTIAEVIKRLNLYSSLPLIDDTGIPNQTVNVNFKSGMDLTNQKTLLYVLYHIGFSVKSEERLLEVAVIEG